VARAWRTWISQKLSDALNLRPVAEMIAETCDIPRDWIKLGSHAGRDPNIDSPGVRVAAIDGHTIGPRYFPFIDRGRV
jgi:hypothetical protein